MKDKVRIEFDKVSTVASQREASRFDPHLGPFCVEFACSPRVCVGSLRVLRLPPTPVQGVPHLPPDDRWDRLQPPHNLSNGLSGYRKWMDGSLQ